MRFLKYIPLICVLSACTVWQPSFMGSEYAHHGGADGFNAPPGAPAKNLGYEYNAEKNAQQNAAFRDIARDLVGKMESAGVTARPVYVETLHTPNAFNTSLDYAVREELRTRGYTLVPSAGSDLHIRYQAYREGDEKTMRRGLYNEDKNIYVGAYDPAKPQDFIFTLNMLRENQSFAEVKTRRTMPSYGYVTGEGTRKVPDRIMERLNK